MQGRPAGFTSGLHTFANPVLLLMNTSYSSLVWLPISYEKALVAQSCPTLCHPVDCSLPLPKAFSRQEYWSGLPFPSPGDLPDPGIKPASLMTLALTGRFFTTSTTGEAPLMGVAQTLKRTVSFQSHQTSACASL